MDIYKYGQPYPTFQTSQYFTQGQEQKDSTEYKGQIQNLKLSQELEPSISPILLYSQSNPFVIDQSVINKADQDSNSNILQRASDLQNAYMMLENANSVTLDNKPAVNPQVPKVQPIKKDENQETLKQLREFLVDQIEDVSLNDIYKNYELLTNYCLKQQFLLQNKHFDPKQYFQGRKISNEDFYVSQNLQTLLSIITSNYSKECKILAGYIVNLSNKLYLFKTIQKCIHLLLTYVKPFFIYSKDLFPEKKIQSQTLKAVNKPLQNSLSEQYIKNQNPKQRQIIQLDFVKEESYSGSATPQSPALSNNNTIGNYAKIPQQQITPIKKNSINLSSASTKIGFQPSSGASSYINNSSQVIDMSRSLLQSKNLMIQGSSQNIHNVPDFSVGDTFQSKGENVNTQNIVKLQNNKDIKKENQINKNKFTPQASLVGNQNQYSPKSKLEQQINLFENSNVNAKNKNYIQYIRDYQNNSNKQESIKNYSSVPSNANIKQNSSITSPNSQSTMQNPSGSILKNVQINLFTNKGLSTTSTDNFRKSENQMSSSNRLRSSNHTVSPKNSQTDQMKNSFTKKDKPFSILKQTDSITSPQQVSQNNQTKKGITVNLSLNNRTSPKNSTQSSRLQQHQINNSTEKQTTIESNRVNVSANQSLVRQENAKKQLSSEKARKSITIHLDSTKYYQYNNKSPISHNSENKNQKSQEFNSYNSHKSLGQNTSYQLQKDQVKLSNEINKINNLIDLDKQQYPLNQINYVEGGQPQQNSINQIPYNLSTTKQNYDTVQNKEDKQFVNKKQSHYTIPLIKALNLSKVSSQAFIGEDGGSQREIKEYTAQSAANSRAVSPKNILKERKMGSPGNSLNNSKNGRLSSSLQPTPRDHPDSKMHNSIIQNDNHNQVAKNIASVISILNKKVKKESQSQATLRAINQMLSAKKSPLSPSQRSLSRGQTNIGTPLPSGFQGEFNSRNASQIFLNNFSTQQIPSVQSSQKNIMHSPSHGCVFQPQLNQKYTEIYQQMASLNQKFSQINTNPQQINPTYQQFSQSNTNSNNASQIYINQPQIFSQTALSNTRNSSKNNIKNIKK